MKLAFIGTGKIIADALFAIEPIKEIEKTMSQLKIRMICN